MDIEPKDVLPLLRVKTYAEALLNHERNARIVDTSGAYYHLDPATGQYAVLSGLLPRLRAVFWPHSSHHAQRKNTLKPAKGGKTRAPPPKRAKRGPAASARGRFAGLIKGTQVHREMRDLVVLDRKNFRKEHRAGMHDYTARLMRVIVERQKWTPFLAEFPVYDEALGVGTAVDMVAVNERGELILLEYKTGYKNAFEGADGQMAHSLAALSNTVRNQATLQVVCAALILSRRYAVPLHAMQMYVMRVDDEAVELTPVPREFVARLGGAIYSDLLHFQRNKHPVVVGVPSPTPKRGGR